MDPQQLELWGEMYPNANIGIAAKQSGLVLVDVDARSGGLESLAEIELQRGALPLTVEDRSGSGAGSRHLYYRRPAGNIKGAQIAPGIQAIANTFVVSPWSIHESGNFYTWKHRLGKTSIADLPEWVIERLILEDRAQIQSEIERTQFFDGRVPSLAWRILTGKEDLTRFANDKSRAEYNAVLAMVGKGFDFAAVRDAFEAWAHPQTHYMRLRAESPRTAEQWLRHDFDTAISWNKTHESEGRRTGRTQQAWALRAAWPGRTGATDRANYLAHCTIAEKSGRLEYSASCRTLAEIAGIDKRTVSASNKRLAKTLIPFAVLPEPWGKSLLLLVSAAAMGWTAYRLGRNLLAAVAVLLSPLVLNALVWGNVEWLALLGLAVSPGMGLVLLAIKPQITFAAMLLIAWRERRRPRAYVPLCVVGAASILWMGPYPLRVIAYGDYAAPFNTSLFPFTIPLGLFLLWQTLRPFGPLP